MGEQVAVVRTEGASVSHDRLLAANGNGGTQIKDRPSALAGVVAAHQAEHPASTCDLPDRPESARVARDFTRLTLREWQMTRLSEVAELVVSELVTNALRHGLLSARWMPGEHPIRLRLLRQDPYLMCMVTDPDTTGPARIDSGAGPESGRGLQVIEACSVRWGWQPLDGRAPGGRVRDGRIGPGEADGPSLAGKVVWALLRSSELRRITGGWWPGSAAPSPGQAIRSSNSPSLAPRMNASISAGV
jgi:anti-sigma regulatory factor (Ser/Thr protein kinase)